MKTFLSIDWDYFINATAFQRAMLFPDGGNENLPDSLRDFIWDSHYRNPELKKIKVLPDLIKFRNFINKGVFAEVMIVDSHKHMYDFVRKNVDNTENFEVINIDFHHDCYNFGAKDEVNCGNWVIKLLEEYPEMHYLWVSREDSDTESFDMRYSYTAELSEIMSLPWYKPIYVFLCRSSVWSPPHLDSKFVSLAKTVRQRSIRMSYEEGIMNSRKYTLQPIPEIMAVNEVLKKP